MAEIAREYGIYFIPGTMLEREEQNGKVKFYDSMPIFAPDGHIIDVYRKICPYLPVESNFTPGNRYVTFEIPEKDITIGVMICHDWCFPEISRNLTLMGAEILIRSAADPEGLYEVCKSIAPTRAFENQSYFISLNTSDEYAGSYTYGHSMIAAPEGRILWEAGSGPTSVTITLNMDLISDARKYGTCYTEQLLRQLPYFNPPMDAYKNLARAPVFADLPEPDMTCRQRDAMLRRNGLQSICREESK